MLGKTRSVSQKSATLHTQKPTLRRCEKNKIGCDFSTCGDSIPHQEKCLRLLSTILYVEVRGLSPCGAGWRNATSRAWMALFF
jgi:hypothetical protein